MFDGGCLIGVHGAGAAVVFDEDGEQIARRATYLSGELATTNVAEYQGLLNALTLIAEINPESAVVLGDSELIVRQFNGRYACRKEHLKPWLEHCREAAQSLKVAGVDVSVCELPKAGPRQKRRFGNVVADALATECMRLGHDLR